MHVHLHLHVYIQEHTDMDTHHPLTYMKKKGKKTIIRLYCRKPRDSYSIKNTDSQAWWYMLLITAFGKQSPTRDTESLFQQASRIVFE